MNEEVFSVPDELDGERLDKIIATMLTSLSRSAVQKLIEEGDVTLNGKTVTKAVKPKAGDEICVNVPEPKELQAVAQNIPVDIVYEDEHLLVVNKPKGMVVHPAAGNPDGTLVNALLYHCKGRLSSINGVIRPGIVHRIDKDTSGLLIVAKNDNAHMHLAEQIKEHSFRREYRAVVIGKMPADEGTVNVPLGRSRNDRKKQAVNGINPREAITHYKVLERYPGYDYCSFTLETGRTHQIRVHSAYLGHPVAGDGVYGNPKNNLGLEGQCLHAAVIGFIHPATNEYMEFSVPLPDYFINVLERINK
ncbi:MAG: RluA family pseudouridine synthase [Ruminococcaceae bacterium]|nr:RluA family pseudouridine synthase [Oscillospiraceae bacterium]MBR3597238.1 RluA family pseudouridine synthase [Clostridia bacterium]